MFTYLPINSSLCQMCGVVKVEQDLTGAMHSADGGLQQSS